jgi:hypothetical protein
MEKELIISKDEVKPIEISVVIHWVRHAESCANLARGHINDSLKNRPLGYKKLETKSKSKIPLPSDSDEEDFKTIKKEYGDIFNRPVEWIKKVYNFPKAVMYEPNLSYIGIQQAILMGKDFIKQCDNEDTKYDMVMCSTLTRAMMTALFAFRTCEIDSIKVVPFVSEEQKILKDYSNVPNNSKLVKRKIKFIKDWLESNWITNFDDIEIMDLLYNLSTNNNISKDIIDRINKIFSHEYTKDNKRDNEIERLAEDIFNNYENSYDDNVKKIANTIRKILKNKRGPAFDLKYLTMTEYLSNNSFIMGETLKNALRKGSDAKLLYDWLIPIIITDLIKKEGKIKNEYRFMIVSHGGFIKHHLAPLSKNKISYTYNTEVFKQKISYNCIGNFINTKKIESIESIYKPIRIRIEYANFEVLNEDICALNGLKGIINYPLYGDNVEEIDKLLMSLVPSKYKKVGPDTWLQDNVKFYINNKTTYSKEYDDSIVGGKMYRNKYLKYKSKYLNLKDGKLM